MSHKYQVRQIVHLARPGFSDDRSRSSGVYEVTRQMPADQTGELSYRIKGAGSAERAVRESELKARISEG